MTYPTLKRDLSRLEQASTFEFGRADLDDAPAQDAAATAGRWSVQRMLAVSATISVLLWTLLGALIWQAIHAS